MSLIACPTRIFFAEYVLGDALGTEMSRLRATRPVILVDTDGRSGEAPAPLEHLLPHGCSALWTDEGGTGKSLDH